MMFALGAEREAAGRAVHWCQVWRWAVVAASQGSPSDMLGVGCLLDPVGMSTGQLEM